MVTQEIALEEAVKIDSKSNEALQAELVQGLCDVTKDNWYKCWDADPIKVHHGNWYGESKTGEPETLMSGAIVQLQVPFQGTLAQVRLFYAHQPGFIRKGDNSTSQFTKGEMRMSASVNGKEQFIYPSNADLNGYAPLVEKVIAHLKDI